MKSRVNWKKKNCSLNYIFVVRVVQWRDIKYKNEEK